MPCRNQQGRLAIQSRALERCDCGRSWPAVAKCCTSYSAVVGATDSWITKWRVPDRLLSADGRRKRFW